MLHGYILIKPIEKTIFKFILEGKQALTFVAITAALFNTKHLNFFNLRLNINYSYIVSLLMIKYNVTFYFIYAVFNMFVYTYTKYSFLYSY